METLPEQYYFPVDGHTDAKEHTTISDILTRELTHGTLPAMGASAQAQTVSARTK